MKDIILKLLWHLGIGVDIMLFSDNPPQFVQDKIDREIKIIEAELKLYPPFNQTK